MPVKKIPVPEGQVEYKCKVCRRVFRIPEEGKKDFIQKHQDALHPVINCPLANCRMSTRNRNTMRVHSDRHAVNRICDRCNVHFPSHLARMRHDHSTHAAETYDDDNGDEAPMSSAMAEERREWRQQQRMTGKIKHLIDLDMYPDVPYP